MWREKAPTTKIASGRFGVYPVAMSLHIWDLHPGYFTARDLEAELRVIHRLLTSIDEGTANSNISAAEWQRWSQYGQALALRYSLVAEEMSLRGIEHAEPVAVIQWPVIWPSGFTVPPGQQFAELRRVCVAGGQGRIPVPATTQVLWAQHKYSILARDPELYHAIGVEVASYKGQEGFDDLAQRLLVAMRRRPDAGGVRNALQHMWGYVIHLGAPVGVQVLDDLPRLLREIQRRVDDNAAAYLQASTALSELAVYL